MPSDPSWPFLLGRCGEAALLLSPYAWFAMARLLKRFEFVWEDPSKTLRNDEIQVEG